MMADALSDPVTLKEGQSVSSSGIPRLANEKPEEVVRHMLCCPKLHSNPKIQTVSRPLRSLLTCSSSDWYCRCKLSN
jgi:hypothetical protein